MTERQENFHQEQAKKILHKAETEMTSSGSQSGHVSAAIAQVHATLYLAEVIKSHGQAPKPNEQETPPRPRARPISALTAKVHSPRMPSTTLPMSQPAHPARRSSTPTPNAQTPDKPKGPRPNAQGQRPKAKAKDPRPTPKTQGQRQTPNAQPPGEEPRDIRRIPG